MNEAEAQPTLRRSKERPIARRAVIFGGSGFIGFHAAAELERRGYDVTVCDLVPPRSDATDSQFKRCDVRNRIELDLPPVDLVLNLAAVHRTPGHDDHEYYETNVRGAINVSRWCAENGAETLLFTSSISVYGPTEDLRTEDSLLEPNTSYGRSKLIAEEIHREWEEASEERRLVIARPAVIFGRYERGNFTRLANALRRHRFAYPGRTDTIKSCGYVSDLVDAFMFATTKSSDLRLFNFAYPDRYTIKDICETFGRVAGYKAPVLVPSSVLRIGSAALPKGEWARDRGFHAERIQKLTASTNIFPSALQEAGYVWPTNLEAALTQWRTSVQGEFVYL